MPNVKIEKGIHMWFPYVPQICLQNSVRLIVPKPNFLVLIFLLFTVIPDFKL